MGNNDFPILPEDTDATLDIYGLVVEPYSALWG
jgi:hypothetical protein